MTPQTATARAELSPQPENGNQRNVGPGERLASAALGGFLATWGLRKRSPISIAGAIIGADLIYRGVSGNCALYRSLGLNTAAESRAGSEIAADAPVVDRAVTINKSPEELYKAWRDLDNLSRAFARFVDISPSRNGMIHWRLRGPLRKVFEWDSRYTDEQPGRRLAWESVPGGTLISRGEITFRPGPDGTGTEVHLHMQFEAPFGSLGSSVAKAFHKGPRAVAGQALRRFKSLAETGEIPTLDHNPSARGSSDMF